MSGRWVIFAVGALWLIVLVRGWQQEPEADVTECLCAAGREVPHRNCPVHGRLRG